MRRERQEGWYAKKSFPHFDLPLGFEHARALASDPSKVTRHSFKPFIGYIDKKRKFTPKSEKKFKNKERPIKYCSHHDGYIHSFYAKILVDAYESFLSDKKWASSVIGYRAGLGNNVHMTKNAFNEIRKRKVCVAIAIDINDFFGSIHHEILLQNIRRVLGVERLTDDWFKIFRSMTKYSWVESEELAGKLKIDPKDPPRPLCEIAEFRALRDADPDFVKTNNCRYGIPQGSPISAVMSNVYMIEFDAECFDFVKSIGGFYRRYSDDIFIVCNPKHQDEVQKFVSARIAKLGTAIKISEEKTEISNFWQVKGGHVQCDQPISYLGFTFDGKRTQLRARTLSRYYRRMTYASRHTARIATEKRSKKVYKRKLYRQFSHLGKSNFYSYAKRAASILDDETPKRQLRRHFPILHRKLKNRGR